MNNETIWAAVMFRSGRWEVLPEEQTTFAAVRENIRLAITGLTWAKANAFAKWALTAAGNTANR